MTSVGGEEVVVAVDGGGSKTDVAVVSRVDGAVLGRHRGPGCSQHDLGPERAAQVVDDCVGTALREAGVDTGRVTHAGCYLTAIDLPDEQAAMTALLGGTSWGARSLTVENDLFALLRAGTDRTPAAVVVCGTGINGLAMAADGTVARLVALGRCSGDWGGGAELAQEALWCAARAEDGRGEATLLRDAVLRWSGSVSIDDVSVDVHRGRVDPAGWSHHVPEIFAIAAAGDQVARRLVERQGREIGLVAASLIERLGLRDDPVPVVLGGGIGASGDPTLLAAAVEVLAERVPMARLSIVADAPIEGAILLALDSAEAG
jgi:N-acetylglucosamine kinase-like BadF-type ATPase